MSEGAAKVDFKRVLPGYSARRGRIDDLVLPAAQYLAVDGVGDPNRAQAYREALEAVYPVAYALKFWSKRELGRDYVVPPLEALWWADDYAAFTSARDKSAWSWTVLLYVPEWLGAAEVDAAIAAVRAKSGGGAALELVRLLALAEGRCLQTLHVGPYDEEGPVLARMHDEIMPAAGPRPVGKHHEIYLSDARRVAPEKLRTILRQPVAAVGT